MKTLRILVALAVLALAGSASGQTLTTLHSFSGSDGESPWAGLVQGSDGYFYGTTSHGGTNGQGTVFKISPTGSWTNLYSFGGSDGSSPFAGLVWGADRNLYGTTYGGGAHGYGTVFRITPSGSFTNLHSFAVSDGGDPEAGLIQGWDGNFYGTADFGAYNYGTVFRISPSGGFTNLYFFQGGDGSNPNSGVVQGGDGNFYGTTYQGGTNGYGTVFRISPSGTLATLYAFVGGTDGVYPVGLVRGTDGYFYGTTELGGNTNSDGTVFRIGPNGDYTNLYIFGYSGGCGADPLAGLLLASDGSFYGATLYGGVNCDGTVFRIGVSGILTNVYVFSNSDGMYPAGRLIQGSEGCFYGTTLNGGASNVGTVFRISVPLNPPANQISGVQPVGSNVAFTIPSVAGETYQLQFATDLVSGNWTNVVGVCVSNSIGAALTVTNFGGATGPQGFYRFDVTP